MHPYRSICFFSEFSEVWCYNFQNDSNPFFEWKQNSCTGLLRYHDLRETQVGPRSHTDVMQSPETDHGCLIVKQSVGPICGVVYRSTEVQSIFNYSSKSGESTGKLNLSWNPLVEPSLNGKICHHRWILCKMAAKTLFELAGQSDHSQHEFIPQGHWNMLQRFFLK